MREMTQKERLNYLVEEFKEDSVWYRDLETPEDAEGKKRISSRKQALIKNGSSTRRAITACSRVQSRRSAKLTTTKNGS